MMRSDSKSLYLLNPIFILGLLLLLLNDHLFKDIYGNWFTGKFSDIAGVLILPLFLKYLFPISDKKAIGLSFLFFVFWKSPFSQAFIDGFNTLGVFSIARVIDYTDYLAFLVLPFSYRAMRNMQAYQINFQFPKQWAMAFILPVSIFAFVATSMEDDNFFPNDPTITNCCQGDPWEENVGNGKVFIPTIFTPDNNGLNDFFQLVADPNILRIDTFMVYELHQFDTVFFATNITDITPENGFNGVVNDTIAPAQYGYLIWVTSADSVTRPFTGTICSVPCNGPLGLPEPMDISQCAFATQHSFATGFDPNIDSGEVLDCFD